MDKQLIIKEEEVGLDFLLILEKLIKIRKDKRIIYQDTYLEDTHDFLLMQIENKIKRTKLQILNKSSDNNIEKLEDNLLDCAVYCIFLAAKINMGDKK